MKDFVRRSKAAVIVSKPSDFSGQLLKYTNVVKGWQIRYFIVDSLNGYLNYYLCDSDGLPDNCGNPRASFELAGALICPSQEDSRTFIIHCCNGESVKLRAADARARQEWVDRLRAVVESHSKAHSTNVKAREQLAIMDAMNVVRKQLNRTEQADLLLCQHIETDGGAFYVDQNLLLLKAASAASLHALFQCMHILQGTASQN